MTWLTEVRTVQDWILAPLLKSIPGVSEINSFGGVHQAVPGRRRPGPAPRLRPDPGRGRRGRCAATTSTSAATSWSAASSSTSSAASACCRPSTTSAPWS
ncbi:MAG: hypothetical protein M0C28_03165 [Candidatus Moduliflexus flocculans]|nr:hypothetical protein [Candidatus Moduliflexus flocculans]